MDYLIVFTLVLLSGLFSGLTLGLLSLNKDELERKISLGNKEAKKVYSVRKNGNLLLCTLLVGNVGVNSTIAIFLGNIASGFVAGLVATGLIVIFGEIIPQASFARYALKIGAKTAWLVKIFIIILIPICWPIAWVLDKVLGEEMPSIYSKKELIEIVKTHRGSKESSVDTDEEKIIEGALSFSDKRAGEIMTPRKNVFALEKNAKLDTKLLNQIKQQGVTRIPVYRKSLDDLVGILYVQDLVNLKLDTKVAEVFRPKKVLTIPTDKKLDQLLNLFMKTKVHLAFVEKKSHDFAGVITLEDVIEEILSREIVDETDQPSA